MERGSTSFTGEWIHLCNRVVLYLGCRPCVDVQLSMEDVDAREWYQDFKFQCWLGIIGGIALLGILPFTYANVDPSSSRCQYILAYLPGIWKLCRRIARLYTSCIALYYKSHSRPSLSL